MAEGFPWLMLPAAVARLVERGLTPDLALDWITRAIEDGRLAAEYQAPPPDWQAPPDWQGRRSWLSLRDRLTDAREARRVRLGADGLHVELPGSWRHAPPMPACLRVRLDSRQLAALIEGELAAMEIPESVLEVAYRSYVAGRKAAGHTPSQRDVEKELCERFDVPRERIRALHKRLGGRRGRGRPRKGPAH